LTRLSSQQFTLEKLFRKPGMAPFVIKGESPIPNSGTVLSHARCLRITRLAQPPASQKHPAMGRWFLLRSVPLKVIVACALLFGARQAAPAMGATARLSIFTRTAALHFQEGHPSAPQVATESRPLEERRTKTKARFLAGAGLAIISLLGLAAALALVRSLKR